MKTPVAGSRDIARLLGAALVIVAISIGWRLGAAPDAGWVKHPISKSIRSIRIPQKQSKVIFCATDVVNYSNAGIFVSTDGGATYKNITGTLPERVIEDVAVHPSNTKMVYAALLNSGVYRTTNQGASWTAMNSGLTSRQTTAIFLNPLVSNNLLLGIKGGNVYRSTNGGSSWTLVATVAGDVTVFAADPKNKKVYYLGTSKREVYTSINSGATWDPANVGLLGATTNIITAIVVDPVNTMNVYLSMSKNGVFKSTDAGGSWAQKKTGLSSLAVNDLVLYQKTPSILYAATNGKGVFKSTNGAGNWTQFDKLNLTDLKVLGLALDQLTGKHLVAGTANAIFDYTLTAP